MNNPAWTFWRVTLPLSAQGIAAGSILVLCLTIGTYKRLKQARGDRAMAA
jgi:ABC-type spermidine/putrescine transport system permease subunit I